ncbi:MAG: phosphoglycerate mutase family protein [Candidatus Heimdallarchaeota archaeon]|nr:phosphoglycerate mutase family protein [Candidatus Heimdallarchaeota archaeon]
MRLYLIRHAESTMNERGLLQGWQDPPLSKKGRQQAQNMKLDPDVSIVFCSPSKRCIETRELSSSDYFIEMEQLKEMNFGILEGKPLLEVTKTEEWKRIFKDYEYNGHDGESVSEFGRRVTWGLSLIIRYMQDYQHETALIYTHSGVINAIIKGLYGIEKPNIPLANAQVLPLDISYTNGLKVECEAMT